MKLHKGLYAKLLPILSLLPGAVVSAAGTAQGQPNIIFVMSDDQRWDSLGVAGNPGIHVPHMDKLAREGVYFPQATITNPQCMCSRAALITGMATHSNGRYSNQTARKDIVSPHGFDQYRCLPEVLSDAGYKTAHVGKWHMDADPWNVGFAQSGTWFPPGAGRYTNAPVAQGQSRERKPSQGFLQTLFGDSAVKIIRDHKDSKTTQPLFLWMATTAPHGPYGPNPPAASAPYEGKKLTDLLPPTYKGNAHRKGVKWHEYYAAITAVDIELGRVMQTLEETKMSSNTIVVFLGDNGYMMGSRNLQGKTVPWEDSIRVPMIIWGPGVIKGRGKTDAVASSLDLPATLVKLAGAKVPPEWHGRDLTPTLTDAKAHGTTWSVSESSDYNNWKFPGIAYRTVRTTTSKLIVWHPSTGKSKEFYDLTKDPHEEKNLYSDPAEQPRIQELTRVLEQWMKDTDDSWTMRGKLVVSGADKKKKRRSDGDD